jgi:hypothetical protein
MSNKNQTFTTATQEIWRARIRAELSSVSQWKNTWDFLLDSSTLEASEAVHKPSCQKSIEPSEVRLQVKVSLSCNFILDDN